MGNGNRVPGLLASRLPKSANQLVTSGQLRLVRELEESGFAYLSDLVSRRQIDEIFEYLRDKKCYDRWRPESGEFLISDAPSNCHVAPYMDVDVMRCPHLLRIANHSDILAAMEKLFGCKPTLSQLGLWWSLPGHSKAEDAELFHRDVDEWQFIKLFVYLTDVDSCSGPHVFIKGSPAVKKLIRIQRYADCDVEREFGMENIIRFTGKAGTAFLENTFGLHKGQMPTSGNRLLFQAQYSLHRIGIYRYNPLLRGPEDSELDPYINRLFLR